MKALIIDVVYDGIAPELSKYMTVDTKIRPSKEELIQIIPDYDLLVMRVDPAIDAEIMDAAKNLKVIAVSAVGLNHIDLDAAKARNIQVFNAPGLSTNAVAELSIAKMLEMARHTVAANVDVTKNHHWNKYRFLGCELQGKTLGILGFGRIGQRVGELGRAFGMNLIAYDPYLPAPVFEQQQAKSVSIKELVETADFVSIHMPLTPETKDLFNAESISRMKHTAVVINMSRGGIVNEQDMYNALQANKIGGYSTDVMASELNPDADVDSPLFQCENFVVSPHLGMQTSEAFEAIGLYVIDKIKEIMKLG